MARLKFENDQLRSGGGLVPHRQPVPQDDDNDDDDDSSLDSAAAMAAAVQAVASSGLSNASSSGGDRDDDGERSGRFGGLERGSISCKAKFSDEDYTFGFGSQAQGGPYGRSPSHISAASAVSNDGSGYRRNTVHVGRPVAGGGNGNSYSYSNNNGGMARFRKTVPARSARESIAMLRSRHTNGALSASATGAAAAAAAMASKSIGGADRVDRSTSFTYKDLQEQEKRRMNRLRSSITSSAGIFVPPSSKQRKPPQAAAEEKESPTPPPGDREMNLRRHSAVSVLTEPDDDDEEEDHDGDIDLMLASTSSLKMGDLELEGGNNDEMVKSEESMSTLNEESQDLTESYEIGSNALASYEKRRSMDMSAAFAPPPVAGKIKRAGSVASLHSSSSMGDLQYHHPPKGLSSSARKQPQQQVKQANTSSSTARRRNTQSSRRVSFAERVEAAVDHRLENYVTNMVSNLSREQRRQQDDYASTHNVSFRHFAMLSVTPETLSSASSGSGAGEAAADGDCDRFIDEGPRYLDSFFLDTADALDQYPPPPTETTPKKKAGGEDEGALDPMALSTFCFPDGLRVRIVPRVAMEGAKRLGWIGRDADKSHLLVFTDGLGATSHGVAITVREEIVTSGWGKVDVLAAMNERRRVRWATARICRWWQKCRLPAHGCDTSRCDVSMQSDTSPRGALDLVNTSKSTRKLRRSESAPDTYKIELPYADPSIGTGNAAWKDYGAPSSRSAFSESLEITESKRKKVSKQMKKALGLKSGKKTKTENESEGKVKKKGIRKKLMKRIGSSSVKKEKGKATANALTNNIEISEKAETTAAKVISDWARKRGVEAYNTMVEADQLGDACLTEKCYCIIGGRAGDQALLLAGLQQLVDCEREENLLRSHGGTKRLALGALRSSSSNRRPTCSLGDRNEVEQSFRDFSDRLDTRRHNILTVIQTNLRLSDHQANMSLAPNQFEQVYGTRKFFELSLPIRNSTPLKLPLPLPQVGKEWGLAKLLLTIGPDSLLIALKLLLLERSVLVLGESSEEVTACCRALLELIKPFEWVSTFMPVLPYSMLDFVQSPVPFVAGMSVEGVQGLNLVENDERVIDAMITGASLINLKTGSLLITSEQGVANKLSLNPNLRQTMASLHKRLIILAQDKTSALHYFPKFFKTGLSPQETATLHSASTKIEHYLTGLLGDLRGGFERYSKFDAHCGEFQFQPSWFVSSVRAEISFQEELANTQLFSGYVDGCQKRIKDVEEERNGRHGIFIAEWLYYRRLLRKKLHTGSM